MPSLDPETTFTTYENPTLQSAHDNAHALGRLTIEHLGLTWQNRFNEYRAEHDELTGLFNKHGLAEQMKLYPRPEAALAIDADNFKSVNDTLGHERGDRLLKDIAIALKHSVRPTDTVARPGGDEFVILLHGGSREGNESGGGYETEPELTPQTIAKLTKERITNATHEFMQRPDNADLHGLGFGLSVGSAIRKGDMDIKTLLDQADSNMYADKRGKDS